MREEANYISKDCINKLYVKIMYNYIGKRKIGISEISESRIKNIPRVRIWLAPVRLQVQKGMMTQPCTPTPPTSAGSIQKEAGRRKNAKLTI
jgi:hypothetical protein